MDRAGGADLPPVPTAGRSARADASALAGVLKKRGAVFSSKFEV
jgi:hypothetical protein